MTTAAYRQLQNSFVQFFTFFKVLCIWHCYILLLKGSNPFVPGCYTLVNGLESEHCRPVEFQLIIQSRFAFTEEKTSAYKTAIEELKFK